MKPGEDPSPPETLKKAGAAEQVRDINDLRKKSRSRPGADPEQGWHCWRWREHSVESGGVSAGAMLDSGGCGFDYMD